MNSGTPSFVAGFLVAVNSNWTMMNEYDIIAKRIAGETIKEHLVYASCNCKMVEEFRDGSKAEYHTNFKKAALAWASNAIYRRMYWAIHHGNRHIIHVRNRYGLSAPTGLKTMTAGVLFR